MAAATKHTLVHTARILELPGEPLHLPHTCSWQSMRTQHCHTSGKNLPTGQAAASAAALPLPAAGTAESCPAAVWCCALRCRIQLSPSDRCRGGLAGPRELPQHESTPAAAVRDKPSLIWRLFCPSSRLGRAPWLLLAAERRRRRTRLLRPQGSSSAALRGRGCQLGAIEPLAARKTFCEKAGSSSCCSVCAHAEVRHHPHPNGECER